MMIKLSDEQIAQLGGITKASEFPAAFSKLHTEAKADKTNVISLADAEAMMTAQAKTFSASVASLETKVATVDMEAIDKRVETLATTVATKTGSLTAAKALGKVGASGAAAVETNPTDEAKETTKTFSAIVADFVASGKTKGEAVKLAIATNPKAYAVARAAGNINL